MWGEHIKQHILAALPRNSCLNHRLERKGRRNHINTCEARRAAHTTKRPRLPRKGLGQLQDALPHLTGEAGQVEHGGCFAHAAFEIGDRCTSFG